jgi:hypothetical protein
VEEGGGREDKAILLPPSSSSGRKGDEVEYLTARVSFQYLFRLVEDHDDTRKF